jgi:hypothetical protein
LLTINPKGSSMYADIVIHIGREWGLLIWGFAGMGLFCLIGMILDAIFGSGRRQ